VTRDEYPSLDKPEYQKLEDFRYQIRRFLHFSEAAARAAGLEPQQHQALLALKGMPQDCSPTIGHLAERLMLKHHSVVGLVDRLQTMDLLVRRASPDDARQVLVELTTKGERILRELSRAHRTELEEMSPKLLAALRAISASDRKTQVHENQRTRR
jgi:DNA-binding MarR family transcriptional regulator